MNHQIRRFGLVLILLFVAMFAQLNYLQVVRADHYANDPGNSRNAVRDFGEVRGAIKTSDGRVIAESYPNPQKKSNYTYLRRYPGGSLYGHLTGYFSFTFGSTGLERQYNGELAGRKTALTTKRLADMLRSKTVTSDVTITINDQLQRFAALQLRKRKGAIVVLDPRTGAILAMVSYPSYDPAVFEGTDFAATQVSFDKLNKDADHPLLARSYRQRFPPGSTFKVVTTATGIETKVAGPDTVYPLLRALPLRYSTRPLRNFGGSECGGALSAGFRVSCNTVFAQLGLDLKGPRLTGGAEAFGFNHQPPLDVSPGASKSFFPPVEFFVKNDPQLAQSAIGQGSVTATPLEMAMVAGAIANDGRIMRPHLMQEIKDSDGAVVESEPGGVWLHAVSESTAATVKVLMVDAVRAGTGTRAAIPGVDVAAKTGTAQTGRGTAHAWTIGFAPAENPRFAIAVIIEDQPDSGAATGGRIAAPIVREVLTKALQVL
jgi:penicillin-binding protein A